MNKITKRILPVAFALCYLSGISTGVYSQNTTIDEPVPSRIGVGNHGSVVNSVSSMLAIALRSYSSPDILRYKNVTSVEYWNGSAWVNWQTDDWKRVLDASDVSRWKVYEQHSLFRFTIDLGGSWYRPSAFLVGQDWGAGELSYRLKIESSMDENTWTGRLPFTGVGADQALNIFVINSQMSEHRYVRLTFDTGASGSNYFNFFQLSAFTKRAVGLSGSSSLPFTVSWDKNIGIGTTNTDEKLTVAGTVKSREVIVEENTGADFVFEEDYDLSNLSELETFIKINKHLPDVPTAEQMKNDGVKVGELQIKLLQKIEELTLYIIEQQKQIEELKSANKKGEDK